MIDQNTELKAGGKVRISGVWHDIEGNDVPHITVKGEGWTARAIVHFIEAYEPPKPKAEPFDWFTGSLDGFAMTELHIAQLKEALTKQHGDPTIRTYAPLDCCDDFGITTTTDVLFWNDNDSKSNRWEECEFRHLNEGDVWRRQPAAPKGVRL